MLRRLAVLAALAAVGAFVLACGNQDDSTAGASTETPPPAGQTSSGSPPAVASRGVRLVTVGSFDQPLFVTSPPRDRRRVFVVEQPGRIRVIENGHKLARPFLDIASQVQAGGEQGLLGLAFAPDYARSGRFYVYFTRRDGRQTLVEYRRANADRANPSSARRVFVHDDPEANHNGGMVVFGPDRYLYVGTGDGGGGFDQHGSRGNAQNLSSPLGKILRIDPTTANGGPGFRVPASNPFAGRPGARGEIWDYGLRNPWRFSFDRRTDDLVIGDVGQNEIEEIDLVRKGHTKGRNFGWRPFEGRARRFDEPAPGAVAPVITHSHDGGWCSITGGYVVRDRSLGGLYGRYVYGDYCKGEVWSAKLGIPRAGSDRRVAGLRKIGAISSFGEDARGRVYVTTLDGPVYRFAAR
jgi:glucose/arabinose dehydrogenase